MRHGDTDFSKLVNVCPVKKFAFILIPVSAQEKRDDLWPYFALDHSVHPPPPPPPSSSFCLGGWGGGGCLASNQILKKGGGGLTGSKFLERGVLGKRGLAFFLGDCSFYIKNKLKSEIFNKISL